MRQGVGTAPSAWLTSGPIVVPNAALVLATFVPGTTKVVRFAGPHTLYRAAGWYVTKTGEGRMASAYGSWWADEMALVAIGNRLAQFESWLPPELLKKAWPAQYRGAAALCEDWNDMREMFKLQLPAGDQIEGLVGVAAPQSQKSTLDPKSRKTPMLQGGGEQVYFKAAPGVNTVNPLWVYETRLW